MGGSAGGLLVGAVLNMRPDLFRGAVTAVPFVDVVTTMLDDSIPLTSAEYDEWGDPRDETAYSPASTTFPHRIDSPILLPGVGSLPHEVCYP